MRCDSLQLWSHTEIKFSGVLREERQGKELVDLNSPGFMFLVHCSFQDLDYLGRGVMREVNQWWNEGGVNWSEFVVRVQGVAPTTSGRAIVEHIDWLMTSQGDNIGIVLGRAPSVPRTGSGATGALTNYDELTKKIGVQEKLKVVRMVLFDFVHRDTHGIAGMIGAIAMLVLGISDRKARTIVTLLVRALASSTKQANHEEISAMR